MMKLCNRIKGKCKNATSNSRKHFWVRRMVITSTYFSSLLPKHREFSHNSLSFSGSLTTHLFVCECCACDCKWKIWKCSHKTWACIITINLSFTADSHNRQMMAPKDPQITFHTKLWILQVPRFIRLDFFLWCICITVFDY